LIESLVQGAEISAAPEPVVSGGEVGGGLPAGGAGAFGSSEGLAGIGVDRAGNRPDLLTIPMGGDEVSEFMGGGGAGSQALRGADLGHALAAGATGPGSARGPGDALSTIDPLDALAALDAKLDGGSRDRASAGYGRGQGDLPSKAGAGRRATGDPRRVPASAGRSRRFSALEIVVATLLTMAVVVLTAAMIFIS
jgi:hypothetical protein